MTTQTTDQTQQLIKGKAAIEALKSALQTGLDDLCAITIQDALEPAQPGDKVFPATYLGKDENGNDEATYAWEEVGNGENKRRLFLLDSIPSQARRLATALLKLSAPPVPRLLLVDGVDKPIIGTDHQPVSTLTANHRLYDMVFQSGKFAKSGNPSPETTAASGEKSKPELTFFAESYFGRALLGANQANASPVFEFCPSVLLFGGWNSRLSSWGTKFRRAITSRIVAEELSSGRRTASRVDILGIEHVGTVEYDKKTPHRWKLLSAEDAKSKAAEGAERKELSKIGLGFIPPSVESQGGIYAENVTHSVVLNIAELRHLRFNSLSGGADEAAKKETEQQKPARNALARSVLATLGLLAYAMQAQGGYNLRAGCLLRRKQSTVQVVLRGHSPDKDKTLMFETLDELLAPLKELYLTLTQSEGLKTVGLDWCAEENFPKVRVGDELAKVLKMVGVEFAEEPTPATS